METNEDPLKGIADTLVETYNKSQKRRRPMVEELAGASGMQRALVIGAIEFGSVVEECCHIALKALGVNPAFCQAQTFNLDQELNTAALACSAIDRWQASAEIAEVIARALTRENEVHGMLAGDKPGATGGQPYPDASVVLGFILPLADAQFAKVTERRKRLAAASDLTSRARLECADRLLKRIRDVLEGAHGRNPYTMPDSASLQRVYDQAVRDGDVVALSTLAGLQQMSAQEYSATRADLLRFDDAGTQYGFALMTELLCQLVSPLLSEPAPAPKK